VFHVYFIFLNGGIHVVMKSLQVDGRFNGKIGRNEIVSRHEC
jgi:hypothetical protein